MDENKNEKQSPSRKTDKLLIFVSVLLISVIGILMLMAEQAEISNLPEERISTTSFSEPDVAVSAAEESVFPLQTETEKVQTDKININCATKSELMFLDGIGEKKAESIIAYREVTPFSAIEDIMNVKGIGPKTYEKNKDRICVK